MDTNNIENNVGQPKSNGALVGAIIIVIILIIGGIYLAKTKVQEIRDQNLALEQQNQEAANELSESDSMSDIEADLNSNANIDALDKDLQ